MSQAAVSQLISMGQVEWQSFSGEGELNQHQTKMPVYPPKYSDQTHCVLNHRRRVLFL
jgi:hypothetical protein